MKSLILIPARGGSKGIPKKNIKHLNGKPLIFYTIDVARQLADDSDICVSTDDHEIKNVVENYGLNVPFLRPSELATDVSPSNDYIHHALNYYRSLGINYEIIILLQPTSPFRTANQVREALEKFTPEIDLIVSVKDSQTAGVLCKENEQGFLESPLSITATRRQDVAPFYEYNGALYIINVKSLENRPMHELGRKVKYIMPEINSLDLDTPLDWMMCEMMLERNIIKI